MTDLTARHQLTGRKLTRAEITLRIAKRVVANAKPSEHVEWAQKVVECAPMNPEPRIFPWQEA